MSRNRHTFRDGHIPGNSVLTPQNAVEIRQLYANGESMMNIGITYGISTQHVWAIVTRKKWKNAEQQTQSTHPTTAADQSRRLM